MFDVAKILGPDLCSQLLDTENRKGTVELIATIQDGKTLVGIPGEAGEKAETPS
jgi:hypothetical protein